MSREDFLTQRLLERSIELCAAQSEIQRLQADRLKLDRRIHNQRVALRETWEIVEMRRNYMGSPASRAAYARLLKRHQALLSQSPDAGQPPKAAR